MNLPFVVHTYCLALPEVSEEEAALLVAAAVERAREKHADFDRFLPGIEFLSRVFFTSHRELPLDDYLETLYCAIKHGDFTRSWRLSLKRPARAPLP